MKGAIALFGLKGRFRQPRAKPWVLGFPIQSGDPERVVHTSVHRAPIAGLPHNRRFPAGYRRGLSGVWRGIIKPMRFRKLRIVWSVAWGMVAVLLCVLWVRSYWTGDYLICDLGFDRFSLYSDSGGFIITESASNHDRWRSPVGNRLRTLLPG